mgnify:FL=1
MKTRTPHENGVRLAVGYVRVSTHEQAQDGVSLDVQRDKLRAYCKLHDIRLVDIKADEGISGGTIERPGLQAALRMLEIGKADTLIVAKLDRLTRSVKDLCMLVDKYFVPERYHLLSICGMVNTHTAAGRMMMLNLATYAQFEREIIRERTQEAITHLKAQGVRLGCPPYGYRYSHEVDAYGRRILVKDAEHMKVLARVVALYKDGLSINRIAKRLNNEEIAAQRGGIWHARAIANILAREGCYIPWHRPKVERICDPAVSAARARELAAQGYSLRQIAERLTTERHVPQRASAWHAATVRSLLRRPTSEANKTAAEVARGLRDAGYSFRLIGRELSVQGYKPSRGGRWHPATVMNLLTPS